jgi:hypothetical protein
MTYMSVMWDVVEKDTDLYEQSHNNLTGVLISP